MGYKPDAGLCLNHPAWHGFKVYEAHAIVTYGDRAWLCVRTNYNARPSDKYTDAWQQYDHVEHDFDGDVKNVVRIVSDTNANAALSCGDHAEWNANVVYYPDDVVQIGGTCWVLCDIHSLTTDPPSRLNGWRPFLHEGEPTEQVDRLDMLEF